jgi:hypothetical protein
MTENDSTPEVRRAGICGWVYAAHLWECFVVNSIFKYYYLPYSTQRLISFTLFRPIETTFSMEKEVLAKVAFVIESCNFFYTFF